MPDEHPLEDMLFLTICCHAICRQRKQWEDPKGFILTKLYLKLLINGLPSQQAFIHLMNIRWCKTCNLDDNILEFHQVSVYFPNLYSLVRKLGLSQKMTLKGFQIWSDCFLFSVIRIIIKDIEKKWKFLENHGHNMWCVARFGTICAI